MSSRDCRSTPAVWAVSTTLSSVSSGLSPGGSSSNTSSPAPAIRLFFSASYRSASFTTPPRAVLTRNAVGFIRASVRALMTCFVPGSIGMCRVT